MSYAIQTAKSMTAQCKVIVSTDSEEYKEIATKEGAECPFTRPSELADSKTRLHHVLKHALMFFDDEGIKFDAVLSIQATCPLLSSSTLNKMVEKFSDPSCMAVGTISEIRQGHPYLAKILSGENGDVAQDFIELARGVPRYPRQVRPPLYFFNGAAFLRDRKLLDDIDEDTNCLGTDPRTVKTDDRESMNIDEEFDFEMIELLLQNDRLKASDF